MVAAAPATRVGALAVSTVVWRQPDGTGEIDAGDYPGRGSGRACGVHTVEHLWWPTKSQCNCVFAFQTY